MYSSDNNVGNLLEHLTLLAWEECRFEWIHCIELIRLSGLSDDAPSAEWVDGSQVGLDWRVGDFAWKPEEFAEFLRSGEREERSGRRANSAPMSA